MTDLAILHGVKYLLNQPVFPFEEYTMEYGNEHHNDHDLMATQDGRSLIGEAFNVAPSFFQVKKSAMLKKLRSQSKPVDYRFLVNSDAVTNQYRPTLNTDEYLIVVDISASSNTETLFTGS